jgi:pimeloyl-ACP methyl ester carboxylesterase
MNNTTQTNKLYRVEDPAVAAQARQLTTHYATSKDGSRIHYLQLGQGPGVVLLHGAMESARSHLTLARSLSDTFTVYLPERRGHQLGYPFVNEYSMQKEVEDLAALLDKTGVRNIFGVSAGGLICLQAALTLPFVEKVALYEPALIVNGSASVNFLPRYDREIAQGRLAAALVSGMKGAQLGPPVFNIIPRGLLELLTMLTMRQEEKNAKPGDIMMRDLAPTLHYDFHLVAEMAESLEKFGAIRPEVLLLGGDKSPVWLKAALDALAMTLPHVERIEFPGLDHGGSSDISGTNRSGRPEVVAEELQRFFAHSVISS